MKLRDLSAVAAVVALFAVMALSFLGNVSWPQSPTSVPVYDPNAARGDGIANVMFDSFAIAIVLIAILLGAAMIGGVYLAKMDEPGKLGP